MKNKKILLVIGLMLGTSIGYSQTVNLNSGLQAHYTFSGNANDISGNGKDGTAYGSPTLTTDRFGNLNSAYEFDGVNDLINTYSTFDYSNRTLSLWVNPYDINGSVNSAHVAITQDDDALSNGILRVDFSGGVMHLRAGGSTGGYNASTVTLNSWMHLVLIREGSVSKYYVDNVLVLISTADGNGSTIYPNPEFIIGSGRTTSNQFFLGKIDDIRVYDRAINDLEIDSLFNENNTTGVYDILTEPIINIYPNPTNGSTTIEQNLELTPVKIELINCLGEIIETFQAKGHKVKINMENLTPGIYFVRLISETSSTIREVIKY